MYPFSLRLFLIIAYFFDFVKRNFNFFGGIMLETIKNLLWSFPCAFLIIAAGVFVLFKTKFFIFTKATLIISSTVGKITKQRNSFRLMCTSLGGAIGVGNAVGVAGAICEGGAGAVFWMLIASVFSMGIKYAEIYLALIYKSDTVEKGPFSYIKRGVGSAFFSYLYAFLCILVSLGMGNLSQIKAGVNAASETIPISSLFLAIIITVVFFSTAIGGLKKISSFSEIIIPFLTIIYIVILGIIIFRQRENLPNAFREILKGSGIFYGIKWSLIRQGLSGGFSKAVFSTEAGLGSAGFTHAESVSSPEEQAKWGIVEVLIDSIICIMTAIAILTIGDIPYFHNTGLITKGVFEKNFGAFGELFYSISMLLFAFTSALCWYYNGLCAVSYIKNNHISKRLYIFTFCTLMILAPYISDSIIIDLSDIANAILMLVNLPAIILLIKKIKTD